MPVLFSMPNGSGFLNVHRHLALLGEMSGIQASGPCNRRNQTVHIAVRLALFFRKNYSNQTSSISIWQQSKSDSGDALDLSYNKIEKIGNHLTGHWWCNTWSLFLIGLILLVVHPLANFKSSMPCILFSIHFHHYKLIVAFHSYYL